METGELTFIIVAGEDDQRRPVPIGALQVNGPPDAPELVVSISQQEWEQAPVVDRDEVDELGQEQRAQEIQRYYSGEGENDEGEFGASPDREEMQEEEQQPEQPGAQRQEEEQNEIEFGAREQEEESMVKLGRELKGARVQDQEGEEIGEISDLVLNLEEGRVSFVIIENGQQQYGVSPQSLREEAEEEFVLNVSRQELEEAETLSREEIEQRAEELELAEAEEARESPEVFRFEQDPAAVFGAPERGQDDQMEQQQEEKEHDNNKERNEY